MNVSAIYFEIQEVQEVFMINKFFLKIYMSLFVRISIRFINFIVPNVLHRETFLFVKILLVIFCCSFS